MLSLLALTITAKPPKVPEIMEHSRPFYLHPTAARIIDSLAELGYTFKRWENAKEIGSVGGISLHPFMRVEEVYYDRGSVWYVGVEVDSIVIDTSKSLIVEYGSEGRVVWRGSRKGSGILGRIKELLKWFHR